MHAIVSIGTVAVDYCSCLALTCAVCPAGALSIFYNASSHLMFVFFCFFFCLYLTIYGIVNCCCCCFLFLFFGFYFATCLSLLLNLISFAAVLKPCSSAALAQQLSDSPFDVALRARARASPPRPRRCSRDVYEIHACACSWSMAVSCALCRMGNPCAAAFPILVAYIFL